MPTKPPPNDLALAHVQALHAYVPGTQPEETGWIKLNTNESPYPPSPAVGEAISALAGDPMRKYPNPFSGPLRKQLALSFDLPGEDWAFAGNGSDEILNLLIRVFCDVNKPGGYMVPSYSLYPVLLSIQNAQQVAVDYDASMALPVGQVAGCKANLFFLTSPNAPTGVGISTETIRRLATDFPGILVVDEAYGAFAEETAVPLLEDFPNLCVTRTFSKSHSLAGMRIGCLLGNPEIVGLLDKVRDSYNVNLLSQAAGLAALCDRDYYEDLVSRIKATRERTLAGWKARGWFSYPSQANFIFTQPVDSAGKTGPAAAKSLFDFLTGQKILVRYFGNDPRTDSFLRISIGTDSEMKSLNEAIDQWLNNA